MGTIRLRLPESLNKRARELARKESVSINQLITLALTEKVSILDSEEYLLQRSALAGKRKFRKALSKVAKTEPEDFDKL